MAKLRGAQKKSYDRKAREVERFMLGAAVYVKKTPSDKCWLEGVVTKVLSSRAYEVKVGGSVFVTLRICS
jgi:hypothetical protein